MRRGGFLRRNVFAIWGTVMLIGGVARLAISGDLTGFVGVGLGAAFLLIAGVGRAATATRQQGSSN